MMNQHSPFPRDPEPLPDHYDQNLRQVDALLSDRAHRASIPQHLADTVYDATVGLLWQRNTPIRLAAAGRRSRREMIWSQLAMAAAVGLAFTVAATFWRAPFGQPQPSLAGVLPAEAEWVLLAPLSEEGEVDYLLDTRDLTFEQLSTDLEQLVRDMEL